MLTDLLIAERSEAEKIGQAEPPFELWPSLDATGLSNITLASLLCLLNGHEYRDEVLDEFELLYCPSEYGPWIMAVPDRLTSLIAHLTDAAISSVSEEWIKDEEMEGADIVDAEEFLKRFRAFAQQALARNKGVVMWVSL